MRADTVRAMKGDRKEKVEVVNSQRRACDYVREREVGKKGKCSQENRITERLGARDVHESRYCQLEKC